MEIPIPPSNIGFTGGNMDRSEDISKEMILGNDDRAVAVRAVLSSKIRLAIEEAEQAAAIEMRKKIIGKILSSILPHVVYKNSFMEELIGYIDVITLPTQALDLALARERLRCIESCDRWGVTAEVVNAAKAKVSALEQAQREGKKYSAGGVRITDDCATVESITEV
jgi:hypothetical protein